MNIKNRIYEDYLKKDRLPLYKHLLCFAKDYGYKMVGILDYYRLMVGGGNEEYILVNRHDIDTSPRVAREMFEIEKYVYGNEGTATYYFRESTIDKQLIKDIDKYGYETGYHYEEISNYVKKNRIKNGGFVLKDLAYIQRILVSDLKNYRISTGSNSLSIASHGDFVNGKIGIQNYELVNNEEVRKELEIEVEAYDSVIENSVNKRFADHLLGDDFSSSVIDAIRSGTNRILILTHPRNWKVDCLFNTKENVKRVLEGIRWRLL